MEKIQVFIIEDDLRISEINRRFTEKIVGYEVCGIASTLNDAKEMLDILQPDLVLLDVYFPDGYGVDLLWYIRRHHRQTDVMMITAAKEVAAVQEAIRGGAIDYIIKPILFERFQKTLLRYKEYRQKLASIRAVNQEEVDQLFQTVYKKASIDLEFPKGIDPLTLQKVKEVLGSKLHKGITAEELGQYIGVSRTTARRYLEYMVASGSIRAELAYGTVGRPERLYFLNPT